MSKKCTFYKDTYSWWYVTHNTAVFTSIHIANCKDCQPEYTQQNKIDEDFNKKRIIFTVTVLLPVYIGVSIYFVCKFNK